MQEKKIHDKHAVPLKDKFRNIRLKLARRGGFGLNEVLGIAAALIIATAIIIPGLKTFGQSVVSDMGSWWDTQSSEIFVTDPMT